MGSGVSDQRAWQTGSWVEGAWANYAWVGLGGVQQPADPAPAPYVPGLLARRRVALRRARKIHEHVAAGGIGFGAGAVVEVLQGIAPAAQEEVAEVPPAPRPLLQLPEPDYAAGLAVAKLSRAEAGWRRARILRADARLLGVEA